MRAVIRRDNYKIEFAGRGETWNDLLRPYFGGPPAPPEPVLSPRPQPAPTPAPQQHAPAPAPAPAPGPVVRYVAGPAPVMAAAAAASRPSPSQPRTWYPPREQQPMQRAEPRYAAAPASPAATVEEEEESVQVEPSADPATLYQRLAAIPGRRSERDAVLAAVWFLTKGDREASADEVEAHLDAHRAFPDIKVVPHMLKHVHRTKMFEQGSNPKAVRLSPKGLASVRGRLVPG